MRRSRWCELTGDANVPNVRNGSKADTGLMSALGGKRRFGGLAPRGIVAQLEVRDCGLESAFERSPPLAVVDRAPNDDSID